MINISYVAYVPKEANVIHRIRLTRGTFMLYTFMHLCIYAGARNYVRVIKCVLILMHSLALESALVEIPAN